MSGKRKPAADPADTHLFREAMRDVKPISRGARVVEDKRKPPPRARFTAADRAMVLVESLQGLAGDEFSDTGDEISFRREGVQDSVLRRLKRGEYRVDEECDLHGLRVAEARELLREFLAESLARGSRCVRIIHGKGLGSVNREPVLRDKVPRWLAQRREVLAFCQARPNDGGSGALIVLLSVT